MAEVVSAGPFATEGERRAAAKLRELPGHWLVVCNKMLAMSDGLTRETDFLVVGERWVFVIDEKSWWGKITGNDQLWFRDNNYSVRSPLNKVDNIARPFADYLRERTNQLRRNIGQWVRGGILLSLSDHVPEIQDHRAADGVFILANVCNRLQEIDRKGGSRDVGRGRDEIKACLLGLTNRPDVPSQIGLYQIDEVVSERGGARIFQATMPGGGQRLLSMYDLGRDPIEPERLRDFYMREFGALQQLRSTGLVPEVADPFPWSDDYLVVPVTPPQGKDLGAYPLPETREDLVNELALASTAFDALGRVHVAKVIHRALSPQAVVVTQGGQRPAVVLTNFFAARLDEHSTIVTSLDALALDDPYAAPELVTGYGAATAASDAWSLGLTFLERIARVPIAELRPAPAEAVARIASYWSALPADAIGELTDIFTRLLHSAAEDRLAPAVAAIALGDLARRLRVEARAKEYGTLDNRYAVQRVLGQGAMARTYLALDTEFGGLFALKQFLRPTLVLEQAGAEFNALRALHHPNLPRIYYVNPPQHDVHVILDYIPGPTLDEVSDEFPWPLDRWWPFAEDLLAAVGELESHSILHRDIKPSNIILRQSDGRPVLIDFGLALPQGERAHPAGTPLYLPPEALLAAQPPPSIDRYAAAAVLFKTLTGFLPYSPSGSGPRTLQIPGSVTDERVRRLATVLLRAVANAPSERPTSVLTLRAELHAALSASEEPDETRTLPDLTNPWVDQVRGLYRNSAVGNADNRGLDSDFVRNTYVPTALDEQLLPAVLDKRPRVVFLSGNPGDGKTAFLEQVRNQLQAAGATEVQRDPSGWELRLDGHTFRSCYDASESHDGLSADEQLAAKLAGLEGEGEPTTSLTVLVAINDGRLIDFFSRADDRFAWLNRELANARRRPTEEKPIWLVDLKRRAFVSLLGSGENSVALNVLTRLVAPAAWDICNGCAAHPICPMRNNAAALRRNETRQRLEYLLLVAHLRRRRHTTMRDLRSAFAYLITGNTSCTEVHSARHGEPDAPATSFSDLAYWRSAFAPVDEGDELLADLAVLDPARFPQPRLDRFLHFHRTDADASDRGALFAGQGDLPPERFATEGAWLAAIKRRLYFESVGGRAGNVQRALPPVAYRTLLPYRYAISFLNLLAGRGDLDEGRERLALGLLRSDGYSGPPRPGWLSLRVDSSDEHQLVVLKQFPLADFTLTVNRPSGTDRVEAIPDGLTLAHSGGTPRLPITLDLYELLMRLADGLQPSAPEFRPLLEDLAPFKSTLNLRQTTDLVLVESQRREHHIAQSHGKIARAPATSGVTSEVPR